MLLKPTEKLKKTEMVLTKHISGHKRNVMMQSQEFASGANRRHSVYSGQTMNPNQDYESINVKISSKEMKSLPKHRGGIRSS